MLVNGKVRLEGSIRRPKHRGRRAPESYSTTREEEETKQNLSRGEKGMHVSGITKSPSQRGSHSTSHRVGTKKRRNFNFLTKDQGVKRGQSSCSGACTTGQTELRHTRDRTKWKGILSTLGKRERNGVETTKEGDVKKT